MPASIDFSRRCLAVDLPVRDKLSDLKPASHTIPSLSTELEPTTLTRELTISTFDCQPTVDKFTKQSGDKGTECR